jgi:tRNA nucleotidyltransferase (CCA-adding enzyme)
VGGSLRDALLGIEPHDYDLATSAPPERTVELFSDHRVIKTGLQHGTVTVLCEGIPVEITTFRVDGNYTDARHPDQVTFTRRITDDLARRDFTVNAMAYHPERGLIDSFGGQQDLIRRILRAVGDPQKRFEEDALRIMRAFRFSAQLDFDIEDATLQGCIKSKFGLTSIARERIATEFLKLLIARDPEPALRRMSDADLFPHITKEYLPAPEHLSLMSRSPQDECARLALFFSKARKDTAANLLKNLKLSNKQITATCAILSCMRESIQAPADARRFIAACGIYAPLAIRLSVLFGQSPPEAVAWVEENRAPCTISQLSVSGRDLMALGVSGKEIGELLNALLGAVLEDPTLNQRDRLLEFAQAMINQSKNS